MNEEYKYYSLDVIQKNANCWISVQNCDSFEEARQAVLNRNLTDIDWRITERSEKVIRVFFDGIEAASREEWEAQGGKD